MEYESVEERTFVTSQPAAFAALYGPEQPAELRRAILDQCAQRLCTVFATLKSRPASIVVRTPQDLPDLGLGDTAQRKGLCRCGPLLAHAAVHPAAPRRRVTHAAAHAGTSAASCRTGCRGGRRTTRRSSPPPRATSSSSTAATTPWRPPSTPSTTPPSRTTSPTSAAACSGTLACARRVYAAPGGGGPGCSQLRLQVSVDGRQGPAADVRAPRQRERPDVGGDAARAHRRCRLRSLVAAERVRQQQADARRARGCRRGQPVQGDGGPAGVPAAEGAPVDAL